MLTVWIFGGFTNLAFIAFTAPGVYFGLVVVQILSVTFI